jgi:hypothetical protein
MSRTKGKREDGVKEVLSTDARNVRDEASRRTVEVIPEDVSVEPREREVSTRNTQRENCEWL